MTRYDKYILSRTTHYISNSGSDERGRTHGGVPGDQTGREWQLRGWYDRPWSCVLRHPEARVQAALARLAVDAALNDHIGYDQYRRETYWAQLKKAGYDAARIQADCSADCTAGVAANVRTAGALLGMQALADVPADIYSGNMRSALTKAGFQALTSREVIKGRALLLPGDVLLYEGHHAAMNVTVGARATWGCADALAIQRALLAWNGDCLPRYGADGEWGAETFSAVAVFQREKGLTALGVAYPDTWEALNGKREVEITGGTVNVRAEPFGKALGVVPKGTRLAYLGKTDEDGWMNVTYRGQSAWVRNTMGRVV